MKECKRFGFVTECSEDERQIVEETSKKEKDSGSTVSDDSFSGADDSNLGSVEDDSFDVDETDDSDQGRRYRFCLVHLVYGKPLL